MTDKIYLGTGAHAVSKFNIISYQIHEFMKATILRVNIKCKDD